MKSNFSAKDATTESLRAIVSILLDRARFYKQTLQMAKRREVIEAVQELNAEVKSRGAK